MASTETTKYDSSEVKGDHEAEPSEGTPLLANKDEEPEELHGCGATLACDPRRPLHRYLVLILMCLLSFGEHLQHYHYEYDNL